jgi:hypothetical protein
MDGPYLRMALEMKLEIPGGNRELEIHQAEWKFAQEEEAKDGPQSVHLRAISSESRSHWKQYRCILDDVAKPYHLHLDSSAWD